MKKKIWMNAALVSLGLLMSGGIVYASAGHYVKAFMTQGNFSVNGRKGNLSEMYYHHEYFYSMNSLKDQFSRANIHVALNNGNMAITSPYSGAVAQLFIGGNRFGSASEIMYHGVPYMNANNVFNDLNNVGINSKISGHNVFLTLPNQPPVYPANRVVSLFDYPHFALGNSNVTGSTTIYSNFMDNLGDRYTLPSLSWNVPQPAASTTPPAGAASTSAPMYQLFNTSAGTNGTFSMIYNLFGKYKAFTAELVPSGYFNNTTITANTGSLEIDRGSGNALYTSGSISSGNLTPTKVYVNLTGVKQIQITFITNGLGMVNPELIKY